MKAQRNNTVSKAIKKLHRKAQKPTKAYTEYIYRITEFSPAVHRSVFVSVGCDPLPLYSEAARLSKMTRRATVTQRAIHAAVRAHQPRR